VAGVRDPGHSVAVRSHSGSERFASALTSMCSLIGMAKKFDRLLLRLCMIYPAVSSTMVFDKHRTKIIQDAQTLEESRKRFERSHRTVVGAVAATSATWGNALDSLIVKFLAC
jgi:hypothetical protein